MLRKSAFILFVVFVTTLLLPSCGSSGKSDKTNNDSTQQVNAVSDSISGNNDSITSPVSTTKNDTLKVNNTSASNTKIAKPKVEVYYFHGANRCVSCIAIEDATKKTLNTYFKNELAKGTIKFKIINVEEDANKAISEKYQAFGSALFVTQIFNGKETKTDLTGDGFKYTKNKEEKFIEILKNKISEYLK